MSVALGNRSMALGTMSMFLVTSSFSGIGVTPNNATIPSIRMVHYQDTNTPKLVELSDRTLVSEALSTFPNSRKFTPHEAEEYNDVLKTLYKPTGRNRFKL